MAAEGKKDHRSLFLHSQTARAKHAKQRGTGKVAVKPTTVQTDPTEKEAEWSRCSREEREGEGGGLACTDACCLSVRPHTHTRIYTQYTHKHTTTAYNTLPTLLPMLSTSMKESLGDDPPFGLELPYKQSPA